MIFFDVREKINEIQKNEFNDIVIDNNLLKDIHNRNDEKENQNIYLFTSFKLEEMEYIWKGGYNSENKKNGKGKEYDFDDNLVFEGIYENDLRKKGIEYYIIGNKKYEGDYKDGKRWNGIIYDINMNYKYELKLGNGYIKEFHENGCLSFEGEIKNGYKNGKGKIFDHCGHLIFDGHFDNGVKNGTGKIYNYSGDLIFDGEFKNGKQLEGNIYKYNNQCELIYKKENGQYIQFKTQTNYMNKIMIKYCIWIMAEKYRFEGEYRNGQKYKGKEYNYCGTLKFDGEYRNGQKYKGKEYNHRGELIFEGEYKNGKKYKGKEYNDLGELIFEGEYKNGKKYNGKGKEYDYQGKLIFEGEYKDGKKNKRNDLFYLSDKLIVEKQKNSNIYIFKYKHKNKILNFYKSNGKFIFKTESYYYINDNLYIGEFKNGKQNGYGKEYNKLGKLLFIGKYKDGYKYNGKEYNGHGELIFNGEYKDEKKWNGIIKEYRIRIELFSNKNLKYHNKNRKEYKTKDYNYQYNIIFEGEYKDGKKYKGKEYLCSHIIFVCHLVCLNHFSK